MKPSPPQHRARKRFGQNFLQDQAIINGIVAAIAPRDDEHLVEIGPGQGALTEPLLASGCQLDAVELDRDLRAYLLAAFTTNNRFALHSADALKFDFSQLARDGERLRIVGNLPYNISTPLIFHLLSHADLIDDMHFMLQLEVVERLAAQPNSKAWGRLGIMAQYQCQVEHLFDVPPEAFDPAPKVQSAIVRLTPHQRELYPGSSQSKLQRLVQAAFSQRRKTLRNNLKGLIDSETLSSHGIDPGARAETLTLDQFVQLSQELD